MVSLRQRIKQSLLCIMENIQTKNIQENSKNFNFKITGPSIKNNFYLSSINQYPVITPKNDIKAKNLKLLTITRNSSDSLLSEHGKINLLNSPMKNISPKTYHNRYESLNILTPQNKREDIFKTNIKSGRKHRIVLSNIVVKRLISEAKQKNSSSAEKLNKSRKFLKKSNLISHKLYDIFNMNSKQRNNSFKSKLEALVSVPILTEVYSSKSNLATDYYLNNPSSKDSERTVNLKSKETFIDFREKKLKSPKFKSCDRKPTMNYVFQKIQENLKKN